MKLILRLYYIAKPLFPRFLQIMLRRRRAKKVLLMHRSIWPIHQEAGKKPDLFPGWPENKIFALILVHDVETKIGRDTCLRLLELERVLGFRSSFNFVPEGYKVEMDLILRIKALGFEVGVHGLKHDGKLFFSNRKIHHRIERINFYLQTWGAEGFYSPSMIRDFQRIHELNILYDQSSFDTDPLEPQPIGINTIFPFFVGKSGSSKGYVELPYTLPQDHTLFIILKEKGIDTWKRKLDWIVEKGGMALMKTHPDYMSFDRTHADSTKYPVEYYEYFLRYILEQYRGRFWHALPKEIARFWNSTMRGNQHHSLV